MDTFQKLLTYSMVLQSVPPILQKRIVSQMIKECELGMSAEEAKQLESMYNDQQEYVLNGQIITLLDILVKNLEDKKLEHVLKIIFDLRLSLVKNHFRILGPEKQVAEIKHYMENLER